MKTKEEKNKLANVRLHFGDYHEIIAMIKNKPITGVTWLNDRITCSKVPSDDHVWFDFMSDPIEIEGWKIYEAGWDDTYFHDTENDILYYTMIH